MPCFHTSTVTCPECRPDLYHYSRAEPIDSNAGSLVLRVAALETRVEDDGDRIEHLENLLQAATNRLEKEMAALERLEASIKVADRNYWRREIAARLWARPDYDDLYPEQVVALADSLLCALEAREKEEEK